MRDKTVNATAATTPGTARRTSGHPPLFIVVVGLGFMALFAVALMMQIQTNEAFITGAKDVNIYKPDWAILLQIPNLIGGNSSASDSAATIFGYCFELVYLAFIVCYDILHDSLHLS